MKGLFDLQACVQDVADAQPDQKDAKKALCLPTIQQAQRNAGQIEQGLPNDPDGHVDQRVSALLDAPIKSLQALWASGGDSSGGLCNPLKVLETAYPFNAHSTREITLPEFNAFFQPAKGTLSQFIASQKNNLSLQGTAYIPSLGTQTKIGPNFLRTLNELYAIQQAVYPNNATDPRFEYIVSAHLPDAGGFNNEKLAFDGQEVTIRPNGATQKFIWPGPNAQGASLTLSTGGPDIEYQSEKGLWAVARFFAVYKWQSSSGRFTIQGPLPGPGGQAARVNGKEIDLRFDVDFKGVPFFQPGFLSGYSCSAMSK
jgi:type VI protein secretion system component VasK